MPERREIYHRIISKLYPNILITDGLNGTIIIEQLYLDLENKVRIEVAIVPELIKTLQKVRNRHKFK